MASVLLKHFKALLFFLILTAGALPVEDNSKSLRARQVPIPPNEDPFYIPPAGYESAAPGTILASRAVPSPISAFELIPLSLAGAYQLLYRTADSFGNPTATVTTILIPKNANYSKLLSYQVAEDASFINCAPSYALQQFSESGGFAGTVETQVEILAIGAALLQGWVVAMPDHEGPKAAFLANINSGQATLDGVRAALSSAAITGLASRPVITMWGYSGGSVATSFAAEMQPTYAPDLIIAGAAIGGLVPNISSATSLINRSFAAGLIPGGVLGLAHEYPVIATALDEFLVPSRAATFRQADSQCLGANVLQFLFQDVIGTYFVNDSVLTRPDVLAVLNANAVGQRAPQIPLFMYKSINDELSAVQDTDAVYAAYCAGGTNVRYQRDLLSEHALLLITGIPSAILWLKDRMNSVPVTPGCSEANVISSLLDLKAQSVLGSELVALLKEFNQLTEELIFEPQGS